MKVDTRERNELIYRRYQQGDSAGILADDFGLSRQRIMQIVRAGAAANNETLRPRPTRTRTTEAAEHAAKALPGGAEPAEEAAAVPETPDVGGPVPESPGHAA